MKLLLDENLSDRIVSKILDLYPHSAHLKSFSLLQSDDNAIWIFARQNGYAIVSKDSDFHQRSILWGHPPKLVYLRVGNISTNEIVNILRANSDQLLAFDADATSSILILTPSPLPLP